MVLFRISTQGEKTMVNYTACFENISGIMDKRNPPDSVKLPQNASEKVSCTK